MTKDKKPVAPSKLLREAKRFYIAGDPQRSKDNINMIMEDFPDSNERIAGLMLLGDVHYKEEQYEEANLLAKDIAYCALQTLGSNYSKKEIDLA